MLKKGATMSRESEERELEELYRQATAELQGTGERLTVWAGGDAVNQQQALEEAFAARFPQVPLDLFVDLSKYHDLNIDRQLLDGVLEPDVAMLQTSNDFEDWRARGVLEPFKPEGFDSIRDEFKDSDGAFSVFRMYAFLPQYAKEGSPKMPRSVVDLLDPAFRGHIVNTFPHDDDAVLYVFDNLMRIHGEGILDEFAAVEPFFVRGTAAPPVLVGMNDFKGTLTGYETYPDQPSVSYIPEGDFFISWAQRIAMFKATRHKAAARLFIAFVQSAGFQETLGRYTVRKDVDLHNEKWIGDYDNTNPAGFYEWMRDRTHIGELRAKFAEKFGPVVGASPVEDHRLIKLSYGWPRY